MLVWIGSAGVKTQNCFLCLVFGNLFINFVAIEISL